MEKPVYKNEQGDIFTDKSNGHSYRFKGGDSTKQENREDITEKPRNRPWVNL